MKSLASALLLSLTMASANPIPVGDWVYIASEHLKVSLTDSTAFIDGDFTFRSTSPTGRPTDDDTGYIKIPVWLPDAKTADQPTAQLLALCSSHSSKVSAPTKTALDTVLAPKIKAGGKEVPIHSVSVIQPASWRNRNGNPLFQRRGYCCLMLNIIVPANLGSRGQCVSISYRQPLHITKKLSEFYYVPLFNGLPSVAATNDLDRYSLTLQNSSQRVFSLGGAMIQPGAAAVLPLSDAAAITVSRAKGKL